jgi:hypothetical protein
MSVLGGGGFPLIRDLAVDLLRIDPLAEPLAEVLGVRGVDAVDEELEFPIWDKTEIQDLCVKTKQFIGTVERLEKTPQGLITRTERKQCFQFHGIMPQAVFKVREQK